MDSEVAEDRTAAFISVGMARFHSRLPIRAAKPLKRYSTCEPTRSNLMILEPIIRPLSVRTMKDKPTFAYVDFDGC